MRAYAEQRVLSAPFDSCPHRLASCAGARYVDEGHGRIDPRKYLRPTQGEIVGQSGVLNLTHAGGRDAEAEEAGIVTLQLDCHTAKVEHIRSPQFAELWMGLAD